MGQYLSPGHIYTDGSTVTGPNLTEHVSEALFNTTSITEQELKDPAELTDQILAVDGDEFVQLTLQQIHDLILYPGCVVQSAYSEYVANTNLTTILPSDDTIPQNTEGTEIISLAITPRFSSSTILARFSGQAQIGTIINLGCALFKDSNVNAIAAQLAGADVGGGAGQFRAIFNLIYQDSPATTSEITYRIRVGPASAGTMRMNGTQAARLFGGTSRATLTLQEIKS